MANTDFHWVSASVLKRLQKKSSCIVEMAISRKPKASIFQPRLLQNYSHCPNLEWSAWRLSCPQSITWRNVGGLIDCFVLPIRWNDWQSANVMLISIYQLTSLVYTSEVVRSSPHRHLMSLPHTGAHTHTHTHTHAYGYHLKYNNNYMWCTFILSWTLSYIYLSLYTDQQACVMCMSLVGVTPWVWSLLLMTTTRQLGSYSGTMEIPEVLCVRHYHLHLVITTH